MLMKKFIRVLSVLLLTQACSTDFDLTADWKEVTIIYAMLNADDSIQYIKINKAYLDENANALTQAKIPDSLFLKNILVTLEEWSADVLVNSYVLDTTSELGGKESGIFATNPNYLYKHITPLNENYTYKIVISGSTSESDISAQTNLVNSYNIIYPNTGNTINWTANSVKLSWRSAKNSAIYEMVIRIYYEENNSITTEVKYLDWKIFSNFENNDLAGGALLEYQIEGEIFYHFLKANLTADPNITRKALNMDFMFYAAGKELKDYIDVANAQSGITENQIKPQYTNVENGLGIFSSRLYQISTGVGFVPRAIDSLVNGSITKDLNFIY